MQWTDVLVEGDGVAAVADLVAGGLSRTTAVRRVRRGTWQRVLPGVIVAHSGPLSRPQRMRAALAYGGAGSLLSHGTAAELHGLRIPAVEVVEVTIPHSRRRADVEFVKVHQSLRDSGWQFRRRLRCTTIARTVADVAAQMRRLNDVRALVSDAVQRRHVRLGDLERELALAPRHGSALLRSALAEVGVGARSAGEAAFLRLIQTAGLPEPELNARLKTPGGWFVLDAYWREYGVGVEIDGMAWHLDGMSWQRDLTRQNHLHAVGIVLLRFPVTRLNNEPYGVLAEVRALLEARGLPRSAA